MEILVSRINNMPLTKSAKRAERGSKRKEIVNKLIKNKLEISIRFAKKVKTRASVLEAISMADKAAKKKVIKANKASRIKSSLTKLLPKEREAVKKSAKPAKKTKPSKAAKTSKKKK